jgi:hypothetical protein
VVSWRSAPDKAKATSGGKKSGKTAADMVGNQVKKEQMVFEINSQGQTPSQASKPVVKPSRFSQAP